MKERIINIGPRLKQRRKEMRIKQTEIKSWVCRRHIFLILKVEEPIAA